jgi:hypothetical protein
MVNDLSKGKYDVEIETGPAYNTLRQESAAQMIELANGNQVFQQLGTDLIAKNLPILDSEELTKRVRRFMITQGVVDPTDQEIQEMGLNQPQQPDPTTIALLDRIEAETAEIESKIQKQDAESQETLVKTQQETVKTYKMLIEAIREKVKAGLPLTQDEQMLLVTQGDIVRDGQDITQAGEPNSVEQADLARILATQQ